MQSNRCTQEGEHPSGMKPQEMDGTSASVQITNLLKQTDEWRKPAGSRRNPTPKRRDD
jgi:hypothetical protein